MLMLNPLPSHWPITSVHCVYCTRSAMTEIDKKFVCLCADFAVQVFPTTSVCFTTNTLVIDTSLSQVLIKQRHRQNTGRFITFI